MHILIDPRVIFSQPNFRGFKSRTMTKKIDKKYKYKKIHRRVVHNLKKLFSSLLLNGTRGWDLNLNNTLAPPTP